MVKMEENMRMLESLNGRNDKIYENVSELKWNGRSVNVRVRMLESSNGRELWICLKFGPVSVSDMKFTREIKTSPKMTNGSKFFLQSIVEKKVKILKEESPRNNLKIFALTKNSPSVDSAKLFLDVFGNSRFFQADTYCLSFSSF